MTNTNVINTCEEFVDACLYASYRHNRLTYPATDPLRWRQLYGTESGKRLEERFQRDLHGDTFPSVAEVRRIVPTMNEQDAATRLGYEHYRQEVQQVESEQQVARLRDLAELMDDDHEPLMDDSELQEIYDAEELERVMRGADEQRSDR